MTDKSFSLSTFNKIYIGAVFASMMALFVGVSDKTPNQMAELSFRLFALFVIPYLFAFAIWFLSGKKQSGGSWVFNIVMTLVLLGQLMHFVSQALHTDAIESQEAYKKDLVKVEPSKEPEAVFEEKSVASLQAKENSSPKASTEANKPMYKTLGEFENRSQTAVKTWNTSFDAIQAPRILDFARLSNDDEYDYQRNLLKAYLAESENYSLFFDNAVPNLEQSLSSVEGDPAAKAALNEAIAQHRSKKPVFETLINAHVEYGNSMIEVLDLLQQNKADWIYEDEELIIENDDLLDRYDSLLELVEDNEQAIEILAEQLAEAV